MGRAELIGWTFSSSPKAASTRVSFEKPSSPVRPFSSASSVARLIPALRDSSDWLSFTFLRLWTTCLPMEISVSICLIY